MGDGDENSGQDMGAFIRNVDTIRTATGAHICIVHHTGKDTARGARGHSSLRAATDTEIELTVSESISTAQVTKQRDGKIPAPFSYTLREVVLGTDSDGDDAINLKLSEERAKTVMNTMVKLGISADRLSTKGFGESAPLDTNSTPEGKANNRRVEFVKI